MSSRLPLSTVLVDLGCVLFATWTVLCNTVVLLGGTTVHLCWAAAAATLAALLALFRAKQRARLGAWLDGLRDDAAAPPVPERPPWPSTLVRGGLFLVAELIAARFAQRRDLHELWMLALAFFALSYALLAWSGREAPANATRRRLEEPLLWAMAIACCGLTLAAHKPDSDDAFYVNMAVSVVDFPHQALLGHDTLHGIGAPFKIAAYRAASVELLAGFISYLTGIRTIHVCHLVLPAVVAFLTPFGLARLLRVLDGERWLYAVLGTLLYLIYDGGVRGSQGNFAFVRLFQGKAMLLTLALPLIMAHGLRFGLAPSKRRFALLSAAQIAALGTSVTAFWAAPVIATLAVVAASAPRTKSWKTLLAAVLSSAYLLGLGVYFKLSVGGAHAIASLAAPSGAAASPAGDLLAKAYSMVLGRNLQLVAPLALVLMAWPLCRTPLARRFAIVLPLGFFLFLGNPWLTNIVAEITTPAIHWRILWLLPVPLLAGLMFSSVLEPSRPLQQFARLPLFALALALFFMHVSPRTTLARASLAWPPHPKVDMSAYRVALALVHAVPPHRQVLATLAVSRVLPMLNGYSHPLFIKPTYLPPDDEDRKWRERLTQVVSRDRPRGVSEPWLVASLDHYHVEGIAMRKQRGDNGPVLRALRSATFHRVAESDGHEIWTRSR